MPAARTDRDIPTGNHRMARLIDRSLSRHWTAHFQATTRAPANNYIHEFSLSTDGITVVPRSRSRERLGQPSARRRRVVRAARGIGDDQPLVVSVGGKEAQKGRGS